MLALAIVALPWLSVKYAPVAAALYLVAAGGLWRAHRRRAAAVLTGALAAGGIVYLAVHKAIYGGITAYASGDQFQGSGEFGVVGFHPDYPGRSIRLLGLLVDRDFGIAAWQPAWFLVVPALVALLVARPRHWPALAVPLLAGWATATWVALTMQGYWWPGRQLVVVLPLAVLVVLVWLARARRAVLVAAAALAVAGVGYYAALLVTGYLSNTTWVLAPDDLRAALAGRAAAARRPRPDHRRPGPVRGLGAGCRGHSAARAAYRPPFRSSASGIPNVTLSRSGVSTSSSSPAATTRPLRSSRPCVTPGRDLLDVVGDQHHGRRVRVGGQRGQPADQLLPAGQVEPGRRLVEQQQLRVGHQRPGDLHPLALALGQRAEPAVGQLLHAELVEQVPGPAGVEHVVLLAPAADHRVAGADDDVEHGLVVRHPAGQRGAGEPDPRPQLEHVDRAEPLAEHLGRARCSGAAGRRPAAAAWSCRRRSGRAPPTARPAPRSSRPTAAGASGRAARRRPPSG